MELFYAKEKILNYRNTDNFFIDYSPNDLEKNLLVLAQLHYFGNHLNEFLDDKFKYRKEHKELNFYKFKDFVGNIGLYSLLINKKNIETYYYRGNEDDFEKDYILFKNEFIENLEKLYLTQFSLENLIDNYLLDNKTEYLKQSKFFKIDFDNIPNDIINLKDKSENLPTFNSYNHLYSLLIKHVERYHKLNLDWFTEMGMSKKQVEHCNKIYTSELRNKKLDDHEVRTLLKKSILDLTKTIYF